MIELTLCTIIKMLINFLCLRIFFLIQFLFNIDPLSYGAFCIQTRAPICNPSTKLRILNLLRCARSSRNSWAQMLIDWSTQAENENHNNTRKLQNKNKTARSPAFLIPVQVKIATCISALGFYFDLISAR